MTLTLQVGKRYRTRAGVAVGPIEAGPQINFPFKARHPDASASHGYMSWARTGRHCWTEACANDLISEIPDEPQEAPSMVKMVVRDEKPKEQVIEWWLEQDGNDVNVIANGHLIFRARPDGKMMRGCFARQVDGLRKTILCWLPWAVLVRDRDGTRWVGREQ